MQTRYSRRQTLVLGIGAVLSVALPSSSAIIIVERDGTLAEALQRSGRVLLREHLLEGGEQFYVAALDGLELPLQPGPRFKLRHNGAFVLDPMHTLRVRAGDRISISVKHA